MDEGEKLRDLFERLVELGPEDRERFLILECDGDLALRNELLSLLTADAEAAHNRAWSQSALDNAASPERQTADPYRIVELPGKRGHG